MDAVCAFVGMIFFSFFFEGGGSSLIQEIVYRLDLKIRVLRFRYCFTRGLWKNNE